MGLIEVRDVRCAMCDVLCENGIRIRGSGDW